MKGTWRKWRSLEMTTWSGSRRTESILRTRRKPFSTTGSIDAVTVSVMPIAATRLLEDEPYEASRSRSRKLGAVSHRKRFNYLLRKPRRRGMLGDIEPHNPSATVSQGDR